ncbi:MAG: cysteine hydrolase [Proteobacteria bacterium]|nr:cysteine hydrolase [Pseudomonadota bacterium]
MSEAKTLLQMAGAPQQPAPLSESALVMIDCQCEYVTGALALPGVEPALAECAQVLARARAGGVPIVHVQHKGQAGGLFDPEDASFEIADPAAPEQDEARVTKSLPNAFAGTELTDILRGYGRKTVIFAGFMTHMCISSSVRAATDLGLGATVVGNACATRELPDGTGGVVSADELHRATLAALADRFAIVIPDAAALTD